VQGLLDTPYSTVVADGSLDLAAETLDVRVVPSPKGATLSVATPVRVSGRLTDPNVAPERGGLALTLGELVAKVAIPHLLVADALGRTLADDACLHAVADMAPAAAAGTPLGTVGAGAGGVLEGAGAAVEAGGGALGRLLGGGDADVAPTPDPGAGNEGLFQPE
jgi:hypothetical protein